MDKDTARNKGLSEKDTKILPGNNASYGKKPYHTPKPTMIGDIAELTKDFGVSLVVY